MNSPDLLSKTVIACSANDYGIRLAYRRNPEDLPRRCILVGTTNHQDCIPSDPTGYRRFVPVQAPGGQPKTILDYLNANRDQLWAEAVYLYHQKTTFYLHGQLEQTAQQVAESHRITDDVYEGYVRLLDPDMRGSMMELAIACGLVEVRPDGYARPMSRAQQNAFGHALHICGWHKVRRRVEGVRQRVWFLPKS